MHLIQSPDHIIAADFKIISGSHFSHEYGIASLSGYEFLIVSVFWDFIQLMLVL